MTNPPPNDLLAGYPVVMKIPVQWGELDAYGHVNNTVFFRFFESVRMVYLDRCGFLESYDRDLIGIILHSTECRFRHSLRYPDNALVGARVISLKDDRFTMAYAVVSETSGLLVAEGLGVLVSYDYNVRKKTPLPEAVRKAMINLEATEGTKIPD